MSCPCCDWLLAATEGCERPRQHVRWMLTHLSCTMYWGLLCAETPLFAGCSIMKRPSLLSRSFVRLAAGVQVLRAGEKRDWSCHVTKSTFFVMYKAWRLVQHTCLVPNLRAWCCKTKHKQHAHDTYSSAAQHFAVF
jgi:hypothetical protein